MKTSLGKRVVVGGLHVFAPGTTGVPMRKCTNAAWLHAVHCCSYSLASGADVAGWRDSTMGESALHVAVKSGGGPALVRTLCALGADPNARAGASHRGLTQMSHVSQMAWGGSHLVRGAGKPRPRHGSRLGSGPGRGTISHLGRPPSLPCTLTHPLRHTCMRVDSCKRIHLPPLLQMPGAARSPPCTLLQRYQPCKY